MFFSRVRIDSKSFSLSKILRQSFGNLYSTHQLLWQLFSQDPNASREFIFRQELEAEQFNHEKNRSNFPVFYIVSKNKPNPAVDYLIIDTKPYTPIIKKEMFFGFDLRANPIIARKSNNKKNSTKHDVLMNEKYRANQEGIKDREIINKKMNTAAIEWFVKKGEQNGFTLINKETVEVSAYKQEYLRKPSGKTIRFSTVDLKGLLKVTDTNLFKNALFNGLGHSKAFGCGLLLIRRYS